MYKTKMEVKKSTDSDDDKIIDGKVYYYCSIEDALCESHRITNKKTGVTVELDADQKIIYMRMRKRFHFFNFKEKSFYDNVDVLADAAGVNLRTFQRKMPRLVEVGLIEKDDSLKSNSYRVAYLAPDDFLLERKDKKLGWINCLECPVFGSTRPQEAEKVEEQETKAVTQTSPQEPQQPDTKPALPSNDEDVPDFSRGQIHCEHQTESLPETQKEEIAKTVSVYPWGSLAVCKPNGQVKEDVKQWALSQTGGNVPEAENLVSEIVNNKTGDNLKYSFKCEEPVYDDFDVPF